LCWYVCEQIWISSVAGTSIDLPPLYFFDRTGFSERLHEIARERCGVHLITTTDMS
jgi:hypothetical protein